MRQLRWVHVWDDRDRLFWGHNVTADIGPNGECVASGME
jgi:hypothetical protein